MNNENPREHFYYSLDQVKESGLLTPERIAEIEMEVEKRILPVFDGEGREITTAKLADTPQRFMYRVDDENSWAYIRRMILPWVLTDEEIRSVYDKCFSATSTRHDAERFAAAEKITSWNGPVYCEGVGYNEGYFSDLGEFLDYAADRFEDGFPSHLWTCETIPVVNLDLEQILENEIENCSIEDFDQDELQGREELDAAMEKFNELNKDRTYYEANYKKALVLNPNAKVA